MIKPIEIAARRLRVVLHEPVELADGMGGVARSFAPRATLWARLEPLRGQERTEAQQPEGRQTHRLTIRWRGDVTTAMRFEAAGRLYAINATHDPDGRRRDLVCHVEEMQP